jgi:hypothetical protein
VRRPRSPGGRPNRSRSQWQGRGYSGSRRAPGFVRRYIGTYDCSWCGIRPWQSDRSSVEACPGRANATLPITDVGRRPDGVPDGSVATLADGHGRRSP